MKISATYKELMDLDQDIRQQMSMSPSFRVFNREKIKRFYNENKVSQKILGDTINALMELHVRKDEKGHFKQIKNIGGAPATWDCKSEDDASDFTRSLGLFLKKSIEMIV